ncbi:unnamed protein product [Diamesa tonsa]
MAARIDVTGKYIPDNRGKYTHDDAGKYIPDIRGIYISDSRGRYVPDSRGLYKFVQVPVAVFRRPKPVPSDTTIPLEIITNSPPKVSPPTLEVLPPPLEVLPPPLEVLPPLMSTDTEDGKPVDYE